MIIAVVSLGILLTRLLKGRKMATHLFVLIFDKTRFVNLKFMSIKCPVSELEITGNDICSAVSLKQNTFCVPAVHFAWNELKIKAFGQKMALPCMMRISRFDYTQLQEIIHHNFCTLILVSQDKNLIGYVGFFDDSLKLPILTLHGKQFSMYEHIDGIRGKFNRSALRRTVE